MIIYWDYKNQRFAEGLAQRTEAGALTVYERTLMPLDVVLVEPIDGEDADYYQAVALPAGMQLRAALKSAADLDAVNFLAQCLAFTADGDYLRGELNTHTAEMTAALGAEDELECVLELSLFRSADASYHYTHQLSATVKRKVITGDEAGVTALAYAAQHYTDPDTGREGVRLLNVNGIPVATFYP